MAGGLQLAVKALSGRLVVVVEPAVKKLPETQTCKHCSKAATQRIMWAEGMAYVPVCDDHVETGVAAIGGRNEVDQIVPIPAPEAKVGKPKFQETEHPRDRMGRFVEVGGTVAIRGGGQGTVLATVGGGRVKVRREDGREVVVDAGLTTQIRTRAQNERRGQTVDQPDEPAAETPTPEEVRGRASAQEVITPTPTKPAEVPDGAQPAPDADPVGAMAQLRTPSGDQAAWLRNDEGDTPVGYLRTVTDDPDTTVRFDDEQRWSEEVDARGMDTSDQVPPSPGSSPAPLTNPTDPNAPAQPAEPDGEAPPAANSPVRTLRGATTASPENVRLFLQDGLDDEVAVYREAGGDLDDRPDAAVVDATERAAKRAKVEVAANITARMADVPDDVMLRPEDLGRIGRIEAGDVVLLRIPFHVSHPGAREKLPEDPDNPTPWEQLSNWDYREVPAERYRQLRASGGDVPEGVEVVTADQWRGWKRNDRVANTVALWAQTSNGTNPHALAMQETAADLFGMEGHAEWGAFNDFPDLRSQVDEVLAEQRPFNEAFLLAQYEATQDRFREQGITEVELFRGFRVYDELPEWAATDLATDLPLRPLSSFSSDEAMASNFARREGGQEGVVISATVPVERILGTPRTGVGSLSEAEFVMLAGPGEWNVRSTSDADGPALDHDWDPLGGGPTDDFYEDEDVDVPPFDPVTEPAGLLATRGEVAAAIAVATDPARRQALMRRARDLGVADLVPDSWQADGTDAAPEGDAEPEEGAFPGLDLTTMDETDLVNALSFDAGTDPVAQQMIEAARAELTRRADVVAGQLLERYGKVEPQITAQITAAAEAAGGRMEGLQHRLKGRESLARKLRDKSIDKGLTQTQYGDKINDAVRYTMIVDPANYATAAQGLLDNFRAQGYDVVDADNTWVPDAVYKGINSVLRTPDGVLFELQFHTEDSFRVKSGNHADYEAMRDPAVPVAEQYAAYQRMRASSAALQVPEGVDQVGNLLVRPNPFDGYEARQGTPSTGAPAAPDPAATDAGDAPPTPEEVAQRGSATPVPDPAGGNQPAAAAADGTPVAGAPAGLPEDLTGLGERDLVGLLGGGDLSAEEVSAVRDELTRRADVKAAELLIRYRQVEPGITSTITTAATAAGGRMEGLQHRLKGRESLARKLRDKSIEKGLTQDAYGAKINDAIRYTMIVEPDRYAEAAGGLLDQFQEQGYEVVDADNTWVPDAIYKGVNSVLRTPDGVLFELQFHTEDSFKVKSAQHEDYEIMRDPTYSVEEQYAAYMRMRNNWENVEVPAGIEDVGNLLARPNPFEGYSPATPTP